MCGTNALMCQPRKHTTVIVELHMLERFKCTPHLNVERTSINQHIWHTLPQVTGRPSHEDVDSIDSPFASTMMESCTVQLPKRLQDIFPGASPEALDLLRCVDGAPPWYKVAAIEQYVCDGCRHEMAAGLQAVIDSWQCI